MRNKIIWLAIVLLVAGLWASAPARLEYDPDAQLPSLPETDIIPGAEERITRNVDGRSEWAVVAIHGFSATRQETAPLAEIVAERLGANLLEVRLSGHGLTHNALHDVTAEHWLRDGVDALEIAAELGDKIIVIGSSTGATVAAALLDQEIAQRIDTLVMIAPNFRPSSASAKWLTRPAGPQIARLTVGKEHCWESDSELQELYWATCYPLDSIIEVMRLVDRANRLLPADISQRLLMFYSVADDVVATDVSLEVLGATTAPAKKFVQIKTAEGASSHVLAGDIMAPENTQDIADQIVDFVLHDSS